MSRYTAYDLPALVTEGYNQLPESLMADAVRSQIVPFTTED